MAAPSTNGSRKINGQFGEGNRYGRGNPHAKRVAQFRSTMMEAVSQEDLKSIVEALVTQAKAGDIQSTKLLLSHLVGSIPQTVNPDEIELQEMQLHAKLKEEEKKEKIRQQFDFI